MIFKPYSRQNNHDNTTTGRPRANAGVYSSKIYSLLKRPIKKGAKTVNDTYAEQAGRDLQSGDGELMATYRRNKKAIDKLDAEG